MRFNHIIKLISLSIFLLTPFAQAQVETQVQTQESTSKGWQAQVKLIPVDESHSKDVINLVPKQSIMMKAYVWYPSTQTWLVKYPDWDMPGASIEKYHTAQRNLDRTTDNLLQYGHTQNYLLTPVDIGRLQLTQHSIDVSPTQNGSAIVPLDNDIALNVVMPEGFFSLEKFLPAYQLNVEQAFYLYSHDASEQVIPVEEINTLTLKKGEMLERRITIEANGIKGSSIPNISRFLKAPNASKGNENTTNFQQESQFSDVKGIFGFEGGKRIDSFFYSPSDGGTISLPSIELPWWHIGQQERKIELLSGVQFTSEAVQAYEESIALSWWDKHANTLLIWSSAIILVIIVLLMIGMSLKHLIMKLWSSVKLLIKQVKNSERYAFYRLVTSVMTSNKTQVKSQFLQWQYAQKLTEIPASVTGFLYENHLPNRSKNPVSRLAMIRGLIAMRHRSANQKQRDSKYQLPRL